MKERASRSKTIPSMDKFDKRNLGIMFIKVLVLKTLKQRKLYLPLDILKNSYGFFYRALLFGFHVFGKSFELV
jgi:hypothetical protein